MTALAALAAAGLALRLFSARAPYGRAGLQFEPTDERSFGLVVVDVADLRDGAIEQLFADPHIDVSIGYLGQSFLPLADMDDLADLGLAVELAAELGDEVVPNTRVDTLTALRLFNERQREAGGPMGDEDEPENTTEETTAVGGQAEQANTSTGSVPAPDAAEVAAFAAAARSPRGATIKVGGKPPAKPKSAAK